MTNLVKADVIVGNARIGRIDQSHAKRLSQAVNVTVKIRHGIIRKVFIKPHVSDDTRQEKSLFGNSRTSIFHEELFVEKDDKRVVLGSRTIYQHKKTSLWIEVMSKELEY